MKLLLTIGLTIASSATWAIPRAPHNALKVSHTKNVDLLNQNYDFEGIVKLDNCSGSLITFSGQPVTAKAIVMTNGHCIKKPGGFLSPGEVWSNRAMKRDMKLYDASFKLHPIQTTKILYATMTKTDVAYYELSETYAQITKRTGVEPFLLDSDRPVQGLAIDIISGYWDKGYSCDIHSFIFAMKESQWSWTDSIRYTPTCDTIGGTSGSPIIARGQRLVVAINNTSNEKGESCTLNNPCEVNERGQVRAEKGVRYGQQTYNVYTCLTPDFAIDLKLPGCTLPK